MLLVILAALALQHPAIPTPVGTQVGEPLQDVMLPTIDGKNTIRLSELRGKPLLLLQFASW